MKNFFEKGENLSAILLFLSFFFLPWLNLGIISLSAYRIISAGEAISKFANVLGNEEASLPLYIYLLYLIPIISVIIIIMSLKGKRPKILSYFLGIGIFVSFFYFITYTLIVEGLEPLRFLGIGFYLTFLGGIGLILGTMDIFKLKLDKK